MTNCSVKNFRARENVRWNMKEAKDLISSDKKLYLYLLKPMKEITDNGKLSSRFKFYSLIKRDKVNQFCNWWNISSILPSSYLLTKYLVLLRKSRYFYPMHKWKKIIVLSQKGDVLFTSLCHVRPKNTNPLNQHNKRKMIITFNFNSDMTTETYTKFSPGAL